MQYVQGIGDYVEGAEWTGLISITSSSRVVAVLTKSETWRCYAYGAMEWLTDWDGRRYTLGNSQWCSVDMPKRLPPLEGMLRNSVVHANFVQKWATYVFSGVTR